MLNYRTDIIAGNALYWGGFAGYIGFNVIGAYSIPGYTNSNNGLLISAAVFLAVEIAGVLFLTRGYRKVFEAVKFYNREVLERELGMKASGSRQSFSVFFCGVRLQ